MKQETYMLPVKCRGCGAGFDLWSVLQDQESKEVLSGDHELDKFLRQFLCFRCQHAVRIGLEEEEVEVEAEEEEAESLEEEVRVMLDYE